MKTIILFVLIEAAAIWLSACTTSYQHPPVTQETDKTISNMMAPLR